MDNVKQTSSKLDLKKRFYAFLGDVFFIVILNEVFIAGYKSFLNEYLLHFDPFIEMRFSSRFQSINVLSLITLFWSYFTLSYYTSNGLTLGKVFAGLKVVSQSQEPLTFLESAKRSTSYLACYLFGGLLLGIPFINSESKGIPDWLSGSFVISTQKRAIEEIGSLEEVAPMEPKELSLFKESYSQEKGSDLPPPLPKIAS